MEARDPGGLRKSNQPLLVAGPRLLTTSVLWYLGDSGERGPCNLKEKVTWDILA